MANLRKARDEGKLDEFAKDREGETGDADVFNRAVASMARTSKATPAASKKGNRGG